MKKQIACFLAMALLLCFSGCSTTALPKEMPDDFSFVLAWGIYGTGNSYDSKTGILTKAVSEDNVTEYVLSQEETEYIYNLLYALNIECYPETYDPHGGRLTSSPPMALYLTVRIGNTERTIEAKDIACVYDADNKKGKRFLTACKEILDILTATEEWNALPEYAYYFD